MAHESVKIFISYSHKDVELQRKITQELEVADLKVWVDSQIKPGDRWRDEIDKQLAEADLILLLISRDLLSSDFVKTQELPRALARLQDEKDGASVVPVLLRQTSWKNRFALDELQAIPKGERWLTQWDNEDEAIASIARAVKGKVDQIEKDQLRKREEEFRHEVIEALGDADQIGPLEEISLEEDRKRLGVSKDRAREIRASEESRHANWLEAREKYEQAVELAIGEIGQPAVEALLGDPPADPIDGEWRKRLRKRKSKLGLRDLDATGIEERVLAQLREEHKAEQAEAARKAKATATRKAKVVDAPKQRAPTRGADGEAADAERAKKAEQEWGAELLEFLRKRGKILARGATRAHLHVAPSIPGLDLYKARMEVGVPPDEVAFGLFSEIDGLVLFGLKGIYFFNKRNAPMRGFVAYSSLSPPRRDPLKGVQLAKGFYFGGFGLSNALPNLLRALRKLTQQSPLFAN